jgi:hypothetical protein
MAKPKGSPKTGGRQKGVPNKRTERREAAVQETAALIRTVILTPSMGIAMRC